MNETDAPSQANAPTDLHQAEHAPTWLIALALATVVAGICFRFSNLGTKPWWHDEAWTAAHVGGYRLMEATNAIAGGKVIGPEVIQKYQQLGPDRSVFNTILALALDDPKHPPLFYASAHLWARLAGDSPAAMRAFTAAVSLLALPAMYWLCVELFRSRTAAWTGVTLLAVSPFQVLYAQEVREYCLWTVTTLLSTASLLRAMRLDTSRAWMLYAVTAAAALYTIPLSVLLLVVHAIYVFVNTRDTASRRQLWQFLKAAAVAAVAFAPWGVVILLRRRVTLGSAVWLMSDVSWAQLFNKWTGGISSLFADFSPPLGGCLAPEHILGVLLALIAIAVTCRVWPWRVGVLVILLIIPALALIIPDLASGGQRSGPPRYWVPTYLGIQLAVVGMITIGSSATGWRSAQRALLLGLIAAGVVSCVMIVRAPVWWVKAGGRDFNEMARLISNCERPLIIGDVRKTGLGNLLGLSRRLEPNVRLFLLQHVDLPFTVPGGYGEYSDIFIFDSDGQFHPILQSRDGWQLAPVSQASGIWRVISPVSNPPGTNENTNP